MKQHAPNPRSISGHISRHWTQLHNRNVGSDAHTNRNIVGMDKGIAKALIYLMFARGLSYFQHGKSEEQDEWILQQRQICFPIFTIRYTCAAAVCGVCLCLLLWFCSVTSLQFQWFVLAGSHTFNNRSHFISFHIQKSCFHYCFYRFVCICVHVSECYHRIILSRSRLLLSSAKISFFSCAVFHSHIQQSSLHSTILLSVERWCNTTLFIHSQSNRAIRIL